MQTQENEISREPLSELEIEKYNYEVLSRQFNLIVGAVTAAFKKLDIKSVDITANEYDDCVNNNLTIAVNRLPTGLNLFLLTPEVREAMEHTLQ